MYRTVYKFADKLDGNHVYEVGDVYPRDGFIPDKTRIAELSSTSNGIGKILIKEEIEEKPVQEEKQPEIEITQERTEEPESETSIEIRKRKR